MVKVLKFRMQMECDCGAKMDAVMEGLVIFGKEVECPQCGQKHLILSPLRQQAASSL